MYYVQDYRVLYNKTDLSVKCEGCQFYSHMDSTCTTESFQWEGKGWPDKTS